MKQARKVRKEYRARRRASRIAMSRARLEQEAAEAEEAEVHRAWNLLMEPFYHEDEP